MFSYLINSAKFRIWATYRAVSNENTFEHWKWARI